MGHDQSRKLARNPLLRQAYEDYMHCRSEQMIVFKKPIKDGKEEKTVVVTWPTGFTSYPDEGGWHNQSYLTTRLFAAALRGEKQGASRMMSKP